MPPIAGRDAQLPPYPNGGPRDGNASSGVTQSDMLMRGASDLNKPVYLPAGRDFRVSEDVPTFTQNHASAGTYFSTHIPPSMRSHGDVVAWTRHTARKCAVCVRAFPPSEGLRGARAHGTAPLP